MNAPTRAVELAEPKVELIPLTSITPSETQIQAMRRARFSKDALAQLADSIRTVGVLQPVVVRPLAALRGLAKYELVAGERRWLAAKAAGLAHISASVRPLSDEEVLEVQLIENLQREGLHELEEAEGYEALMKLKKINADQVAEMVGKSRSYVYARTKLLALCPEARKCFYAGELDASRALLIARIGHHDTQRQALKDIVQGRYRGEEPMSFRDAQAYIHRNFMLELKAAPFKLDDATLVAKAGTCQACPKRTGNQRDLFADVKSGDVCTDPKCFAEKRAAAEKRTIEEYSAKGIKVHVGESAKKILPYGDQHAASGFYMTNTPVWDDPKQRKAGALLDDEAFDLVLSPHTGKIVKIATQSAVTEALNAKGVKTHSQKVAAQRTKVHKVEGDDDETVDAIELAQARAIYERAPGVLGKPELLQIFAVARRSYDWQSDGILSQLLGGKDTEGNIALTKRLEAAPAGTLTRALVATLFTEAVYNSAERAALEIAKRYKVDPKKIAERVRAERKKAVEENKPAAKAKASAPAKTKKKAAKAKGKKK